MKKYIYTILFFLIICTLYAGSFNYSHIPIQEEGRIKPFDVAELLETAVFGPPSTETSDPEE